MNDINLKIVKEYVDKKVAGTLTGKSAYQVAVDNGFVGTEQEWLAEIKNYEELNNKPQINGVTLSGNKTSDDLSLQGKLTAGENITIENDVISAEGGVTNYNELENKPILQIQSASGTTENITIEDIVKFIPFYKDVWTGYINVDLSRCYKTDGTGTTSVTDFDSLLYNTYHNNSAKLYSVNPQGIPQSINAKNNLFILYQFGVQNSYSSQLIFWVDSTTDESKCAYRVCEYNHDTHQYNTPDFIEIGSGGSQIVSGVVNVNGTITFTDSEGNSFTTSGESVIGADGFSPVATVTQTASGATVSITDSTGTTTANISNGQDGTDYVLTNADKQEIAQMAVDLLPNADTVSY